MNAEYRGVILRMMIAERIGPSCVFLLWAMDSFRFACQFPLTESKNVKSQRGGDSFSSESAVLGSCSFVCSLWSKVLLQRFGQDPRKGGSKLYTVNCTQIQDQKGGPPNVLGS